MSANSGDFAALAVFAKAPLAGAAKTRLIPALGASAAARLQRKMILRTLRLAERFRPSGFTLWCAPDDAQRFFRALQRRFPLALRPQPAGDLGSRMASAFTAHARPTLLIGCDCPALKLEHLRSADELLREGYDAVFIPAEDGGYALVGLREAQPQVFKAIDWGSSQVMAQTRQRLCECGLRWAELATLWDLDRPADLKRLAALAGWFDSY